MDVGAVIALVTGICGLSGLVFAAFRFRRDDTQTAVATQSTILHDMQSLNIELRTTNQELRTEVAALREQVQRLRHET